LGVGITTTAQKKSIVDPAHLAIAIDSMLSLNAIGTAFGKLDYVNAMTDVTGFGLLGHLCEVCEGSGLSALVEFDQVPRFDFLESYILRNCIPGGTIRNWDSYGLKISSITEDQKLLLADPQTSGGLLVSVDEAQANTFERVASDLGFALKPFGTLIPKAKYVITVR
jgi:selenide,water dikinase